MVLSYKNLTCARLSIPSPDYSFNNLGPSPANETWRHFRNVSNLCRSIKHARSVPMFLPHEVRRLRATIPTSVYNPSLRFVSVPTNSSQKLSSSSLRKRKLKSSSLLEGHCFLTKHISCKLPPPSFLLHKRFLHHPLRCTCRKQPSLGSLINSSSIRSERGRQHGVTHSMRKTCRQNWI